MSRWAAHGGSGEPWRASLARLAVDYRERLVSVAPQAIVYIGALVSLGAFTAPLWHYDFHAPQYPEGLPMTLYVNRLGGRIDLVNELNHYVGMLKINQASFPELAVMPWLVVLLCAGGVATAVSRRLWAVGAWLAVFALASLSLLVDFWWWLYVYGHDLDPHAAIKIEPFTPRLFGSYQIMNFHIASYPGWGGIAMMASFGFGLLGFVIGWLSGSWIRGGGGRKGQGAFATRNTKLAH